MTDVKIKNNQYIFGEDGFKITDGTEDTDNYLAIDHSEDNLLTEFGSGSRLYNHVTPLAMAAGESFILPAETTGHGFILIGDAEGYAKFYWKWSEGSPVVTPQASSDNVDGGDTADYFCIYVSGTDVIVQNNFDVARNIIFSYSYTDLVYSPNFQIFEKPSGVDNLDPELTINDITVEPKFRYKLGDADSVGLEPWGYGETLSRISVLTPPIYNDGSPGLGPNDDSCKFNASDYYKKTSATLSQFTTGDMVVEIIFKYNSVASMYLTCTRGTVGVDIYHGSNQRMYCTLKDAGGTTACYSAADLVEGQWVHCICFVNRDEASTSGSNWYINGVVSGTGTDLSARSGTLSDSDFSIGATTGGATPSDATIAYVAAWEYADWFQAGALGPAEWAFIAKKRFLQWCGMHPQVYYKTLDNSGTNLLPDGDMEAADTSAWTPDNDAVLSKETADPYEGTRNLKILYDGTAGPAAYQSILTLGHKYRITGKARSGGVDTEVPRVYNGAVTLWTGTTSTSWQDIDITIAPYSAILTLAGAVCNGAGEYVEFDNVVVTCEDGLPTTATRAYAAYIDKFEGSYRKLYYVGSEWLRMCSRQDSNGEIVKGYLPETAAENLITYFEDFESWTLVAGTETVTDDAAICPDGRTKAAAIISDAVSGSKGIRLNATLTAATYAYSMYIKPGNKDWAYLRNSTIPAYCYFNVTNGTIGSSADCTGYIEGPFYSGDADPFYRCCIVFTGTAAAHTLRLYVSDTDGDVTISDGDGVTPNLYVWGAQVEAGDYMSSPVQTSGSALTRLKDNLQFVAGYNIGGEDIGEGSIFADILIPSYTSTSGTRGIACISDDQASADRVLLYSSDGVLKGVTRATSGNNGDALSSGSTTDNIKHAVATLWETDNLRTVFDGTIGTPDSTADVPDDLNVLEVGQNVLASGQFGSLLRNLRIYYTTDAKG